MYSFTYTKAAEEGNKVSSRRYWWILVVIPVMLVAGVALCLKLRKRCKFLLLLSYDTRLSVVASLGEDLK